MPNELGDGIPHHHQPSDQANLGHRSASSLLITIYNNTQTYYARNVGVYDQMCYSAQNGTVEFNVPLDKLQIISGMILQLWGRMHDADVSASSSFTPRRSLVPLAARRKWLSPDVAMVHCQCTLLYN